MEILVLCHPPIFKHCLMSLDSSHIWLCRDVFTVCIRAVSPVLKQLKQFSIECGKEKEKSQF